MSPYDFVHLSFLAVGDEIHGRTKLQKTVYFLGVLSNKLSELGYRPHFYGPYSDAVASSVNRLKSLGFVIENTVGLDRSVRVDSKLRGMTSNWQKRASKSQKRKQSGRSRLYENVSCGEDIIHSFGIWKACHQNGTEYWKKPWIRHLRGWASTSALLLGDCREEGVLP